MTVTEALDNVYILKDRADCCANLVVGSEKALLFDTCCGAEDLHGAVRSITGLPLVVINSHGHFDHIGGNRQFDCVYLSEADFPILEDYTPQVLNDWLRDMAGDGECVPFAASPSRWPNIQPLTFTSISLGDLDCQIVTLPGHTKGSVGILIPAKKLLLSGDALTPVMCLNFQNHLSVRDQYATLKAVQGLDFEHYLTSHHEKRFPKSEITRMLHCLEYSKTGKFHAYRYPGPPYAAGYIYLDSIEGESVALILSPEEYKGRGQV